MNFFWVLDKNGNYMKQFNFILILFDHKKHPRIRKTIVYKYF